MKRLIVASMCVFAASAFAQPEPEIGESVDAYLDRYSQWRESVPGSDRAWDLMQEIEANPDWECSAKNLTAKPQDEAWASSRKFVIERPEMIEAIIAYTDRASLGMPTAKMMDPTAGPEEVPPTIGILSPHLGVLMKHARLLMIDALIGERQGEHARVVRNFEAIIDLQQHAAILGSTIERFVRIAMLAPLYDSILSDQLDLSSWSEHDLRALASALESSVDESGLRPAVRYERWHCLDVIDWLYVDSEDGHISMRGVDRLMRMTEMLMTLDEEGALVAGGQDQDRAKSAAALRASVKPKAEQVELIGRVFDLAESTFSTVPHNLERFEPRDLIDSMASDAKSGFAYAPVLILLPDLSRLYTRSMYSQACSGSAMLVVAINRHRTEHGAFPETVENLDRTYLTVDPIDPFSGKQLRYKLRDERPLVYSVGTDRDDDYGRSLLDEYALPVAWPPFLTLDELNALSDEERDEIDGDWVLYPSSD